MKDIAGKILKVGDIVAFNPPHFKGLCRGKVVKFTPQKVTVGYKNWDGINTTHVYPTDLAIIEVVS